jgi:hypothetical protein
MTLRGQRGHFESIASLNRRASQFRKKAVRDASSGKLEEERLARLEKHRDLVDEINANLRKQRQK